MFLRNYWYAAAWSHEVGHELFARTLLNEPIVFYRQIDGMPVALEDRCAHRRLQLSMGHLLGDKVQCRYHGLVYDATGACTSVPGEKRVAPDIRVKAYPVVDRHKFLWIWMGDPSHADESKIPHFPLLDDSRWCPTSDRLHVPANYQLIIDNLSDLSHVAYLHSAYTGNSPVGEFAQVTFERVSEPSGDVVRGGRWTYDVVPAQTYATFGHYEGNIDRWQLYEFTPPGFVKIENGSAVAKTGASDRNPAGGDGRWEFKVYHAITPETDKSTHYFWVVMHDTGAYDAAVCEPLHRQMHEVIAQDFEVFVNQQRNIDIDPDAPTHVIAADGGLLQARLIINDLLEREASGR